MGGGGGGERSSERASEVSLAGLGCAQHNANPLVSHVRNIDFWLLFII